MGAALLTGLAALLVALTLMVMMDPHQGGIVRGLMLTLSSAVVIVAMWLVLGYLTDACIAIG